MAIDAVAPGTSSSCCRTKSVPWTASSSSGHGPMDESYLTGEPYVMSKAPGSDVLSGAVNGENVADDPGDATRATTHATARSWR